MELARNKEMIVEHESGFAKAVGAAAVEKPKATPWIILMPFMFIFLINDMLKFKRDRRKFEDEFMSNRLQAMDMAFEAALTGAKPDIDRMVRRSNCVEALSKPYSAWIAALVDHYMDLLLAAGDSYETLVRSAYHKRANYLLILNRLNSAEKEFFEALSTCMASTGGASDVIATVQKESQRLRRDYAEHVFA